MTRTHDLRLLSLACTGWAATAFVLAARVVPSTTAKMAGCLLLAAVIAAILAGRRERGRSRQEMATNGSTLRWGAAALATAALLLAATAGTVSDERRGPLAAFANVRATATVEAVITGQPRRVLMNHSGETTYLVSADVTTVEGRGRRTAVASPIVIVGDVRWKNVPWDARIAVRGRLAPSERLGPAVAVLRAAEGPHMVGRPPRVVTALEPVRQALTRSASTLPQDAAGLLPALVVGDTSEMPDDLSEAMNATGMSHLNAVSGSNVTIVLVATLWLVGWCRVGWRVRLPLALVALALYVVLCRPEPSVVRAAAMGAVGLLGTSWGRPRAACPALGASVVGLLLWDPWLSVSAGFALSALATLGLVLFARPWAEAAVTRLPWPEGSRRKRSAAKAVELFCIPLAAQALCLPLLVALSGSISWVSVPANVAAEPFVAPATLGGMAVAVVGSLDLGLGRTLAWLPGLPTCAICWVARTAAEVPAGSLPWIAGPLGVVAVAMVLLALLFGWRWLRWAGWAGLLAGSACVALPTAALITLPGDDAAPGTWVYVQCDVGQGDGALVRTGPHRALAIDVGPQEGHMAECLRRHGVTALDGIILSHFHADHVGGLAQVLGAVGPTPVYATWVTEDSGADHAASSRAGRAGRRPPRPGGEEGAKPSVDSVLARTHLPLQPLAPGQRLVAGDVVVDVLWPRRVLHEGSVQNNASLVLDVASPDLHALMLGDCEKEAQDAVVAQVAHEAVARPYDVIKVAHHGSANQSPRLYRAAAARFGLIGVGLGNDYGHPKAKTIDLLRDVGTDAARTDLSGDLDVTRVGAGVSVQPQR